MLAISTDTFHGRFTRTASDRDKAQWGNHPEEGTGTGGGSHTQDGNEWRGSWSGTREKGVVGSRTGKSRIVWE
ncbi:hypothetical protein Pmani_017451 [Petrolisthes manimaculis]|uniref:Uncharacterized protein n=1 Tax=Petrolisthes manimaculis TaxID=1843537 RepID=A0AAE1PPG5_9EUCA|nr:hypothetical protein Pmani_017451 [Petrolisthes manimaculis]